MTSTDLPSPGSAPRTLRVLAIPGSLRAGSFNRALVEAAAAQAPAGLTIDVYRELSTIPLFDEDVELATGGGPEPVRLLRARVSAADGVLIATPEYNQSLPGVLKNTIDWLSRASPEEVLAGKPVAIVGATSGPWGTRLAQSALRHTLYATESLVMPAPTLFVRDAANVFPDGRLVHDRTREQLSTVLAAFARWIVMADPHRARLAG
ncbi:MAG: NADPH-dependent FMN reductase [Gemmatimonadaceae bacterium]